MDNIPVHITRKIERRWLPKLQRDGDHHSSQSQTLRQRRGLTGEKCGEDVQNRQTVCRS